MDNTETINDFDDDLGYEEEQEKWVEEGLCMLCGSELKHVDLGIVGWMQICINLDCPFRMETKVFME